MSAGLDPLLPLLGRWTGEALVDFPHQPAPLRLRHVEEVTRRAMGTLVTLEGTSYPTEAPDAEPVFGAFAVAAQVEDQVRLSAYQGGHVLDCVFDLSPGRYAWQVPGPDGATVDYRATFDAEHWTEIGTVVVDGADREVFRMTLHR